MIFAPQAANMIDVTRSDTDAATKTLCYGI